MTFQSTNKQQIQINEKDQQFSIKQQILQKSQNLDIQIQELLNQLGLNIKSEEDDIKNAVKMQYFQQNLQNQLLKSQNDSTIQDIKKFQFVYNNINTLINALLDQQFFVDRKLYPQYPTFECERIPMKQIIKELYLTPQQQCQLSVAKNYNDEQQKLLKTSFIQTNTKNLIADKQDLQQSLLASNLSTTINNSFLNSKLVLDEQYILQSFMQLIYHYPELTYYLSYLIESHVQRLSMLNSVINLYKQSQILFEQQNIQIHLQDGIKFINFDFLRSPASRLVYASVLKSLLSTENMQTWPQINYLNIKNSNKQETMLQDIIFSFIDQDDCKQYCKSIIQDFVQKIYTEKQEDNDYITFLDKNYLDFKLGQLIHIVMSSWSRLPSTIQFLLKVGKFAIQNVVYNIMTKKNISLFGNKFKYIADVFYDHSIISNQNKINYIMNELITRYTGFVVFGIFIRTALNNPVSYGLLSIEQTNDQSIETVLSILSLLGDIATDTFYNSRDENQLYLQSIDTKIEYGQEIVEIRNFLVNKYKDLVASANPNSFAPNLTEEEIQIINQDIFNINPQLFAKKSIWMSIGQLQQLLNNFINNQEFVTRNCKLIVQNQELTQNCFVQNDIKIQMFNKAHSYVHTFYKLYNNSQYNTQQLIQYIIQSHQYENGIFSCQLLPLKNTTLEVSQMENDQFYDQYYAIKDIIVQDCILEDLQQQLSQLLEQKIGKEQFNEQIVDYSNQLSKISKDVQKDIQILQNLVQQIEKSQQQQDYLLEQLDIYISYRKLEEINQTLKQQLQERITKSFNSMVESQVQFNQALNATAVVNAQMTFDELLYNSNKILKQLYTTKQQQEPSILQQIYQNNLENDNLKSYIVQQF